MIFSGIQKNSLIDFPGKISCVLFVAGCNFTCPYCHNPELAKNEAEKLYTLSEEDALFFLNSRKGLLEGVAITGGEPTLQKDLAPFLKKVKALGYPIKLDTNGSRPDVLKRFLDEALLDYIAMDVKTDPENYAPLIHRNGISGRVHESIHLILTSGVPHEFRTTCLSPFVDTEVMKRIAALIKGTDLYVLQQFHTKSALDPDFMEKTAGRYSDDELTAFKKIIAPFVKKCIIR
jgi:pyruvate formate lyase activating enzyme